MSVSDFLDGITNEGDDNNLFGIPQEQVKDVPATESDDNKSEDEEKESEKLEESKDKSKDESKDESKDKIKEKETPTSDGEKSEKSEDKTEEKSDDKSDTDAKHKFPPLHEHPRFKKVYKEKKEKDREIEELRKEIEEMKSQPNKQPTNKSTEVPEFAKQMGYTSDTWATFQQQEAERESNLKTSLKKELMKELKAENEANATKQAESQQKTNEFYELEKARVRKEFDLNDSDINSVMKYAVKHQPTDLYGAIDIEKAYYKWALSNKKSDKIDKKKKVASMMNPSESTSDAPKSDIKSSEDLRNTDWYDLV